MSVGNSSEEEACALHESECSTSVDSVILDDGRLLRVGWELFAQGQLNCSSNNLVGEEHSFVGSVRVAAPCGKEWILKITRWRRTTHGSE